MKTEEIEHDNNGYGEWYSVGGARFSYDYNDPEGEKEAKRKAVLFKAAPQLLSRCEDALGIVELLKIGAEPTAKTIIMLDMLLKETIKKATTLTSKHS